MTILITPAEFEARCQEVFGTNRWKARFVRVSRVSRAQVYRWLNAKHKVPGYALSILDLLEALPEPTRRRIDPPQYPPQKDTA